VVLLPIVLLDCPWRSTQIKLYVVCFVSFTNQVPQFASQNFFEWLWILPDDGDLDFTLPQRRRYFQPDEAGTDHHRALRVLCLVDDAPAVGQTPQITDVGQIVPRNCEANRLAAGRQQQSAVIQR